MIGHTLWVTAYDDAERWPAGEYPTQSGPDTGITDVDRGRRRAAGRRRRGALVRLRHPPHHPARGLADDARGHDLLLAQAVRLLRPQPGAGPGPVTRYGAMYGPDVTFLGVPRCDLDDPATYADADVVILGAPFDGGTSHRPAPGSGPQAIRTTDYLPQDGSRPSLALRTDGLRRPEVVRRRGRGDVRRRHRTVAARRWRPRSSRCARSGAIPVSLGGDHSIAFPDAKGCANVLGPGRVSMIHFDAHADTGDISFGSLWGHGQPMRRLIESGALRGDRFLQIGLRGYWPPPETLDWMAEQRMRSYEMTEIVHRGLAECLTEAFAIATDECEGVFLSVDIDVVRPRPRPGHRHAGARWAVGPRAARRGPPDLPRAAGGRDGRGRGQPAVRPRRHHRRPGQPGGARGAVGHRPAPPGRRRRHHLGPGPAAARPLSPP